MEIVANKAVNSDTFFVRSAPYKRAVYGWRYDKTIE
jgi:hypothetical protein